MITGEILFFAVLVVFRVHVFLGVRLAKQKTRTHSGYIMSSQASKDIVIHV